jgi:2,3-bisphosphoglycerate-independent phosphoglycerate mutase
MADYRVLMIVLDGIGDRPGQVPGGRTPLEAAETPVLNQLSREGRSGLLDPVPPGVKPASDTAHLFLLGYDPLQLQLRRGPLEALGCGIIPDEESIAFRVNFATVDAGGRLIDRRAGRIPDTRELCDAIREGVDLSASGLECDIAPGTGHRGALVLRGPGLGEGVTANDPVSPGTTPPPVRPLTRDPADRKTAAGANELIRQARAILVRHPANRRREEEGHLPANMLLVRGAGRSRIPAPFREVYGVAGAVVAETALIRGIGKALGMEVIPVPDRSPGALVRAAAEALQRHDFVLVNLKGADDAGHDRDPAAKTDAIERIDRALLPVIDLPDCITVVCGDHSTPCAVGDHTRDPVPLLIRGGSIPPDPVGRFTETACQAGSLGRITGPELQSLLHELFDKTDKVTK